MKREREINKKEERRIVSYKIRQRKTVKFYPKPKIND
jgi:hypothetical protein